MMSVQRYFVFLNFIINASAFFVLQPQNVHYKLDTCVFFDESFVDKESICNFAAQFDIVKHLIFKEEYDCSTCKRR